MENIENEIFCKILEQCIGSNSFDLQMKRIEVSDISHEAISIHN